MKITMLKANLEAFGFEVSYCRKDYQEGVTDQEPGEERYRVASILSEPVFLLVEPISTRRMAAWELVSYDDHSSNFVRESGLLEVRGIEFTDWTPFPEEDFLSLLDAWGFTSEIRGF